MTGRAPRAREVSQVTLDIRLPGRHSRCYKKSTCAWPRGGPSLASGAACASAILAEGSCVSFHDLTIFSIVPGAHEVGPERESRLRRRSDLAEWADGFRGECRSLSVCAPASISCSLGRVPRIGTEPLLSGSGSCFFAASVLGECSAGPSLLTDSAVDDLLEEPGAKRKK